MKSLVAALLLIPSLAFAHCKRDTNEVLKNMHEAQNILNEAWDLYMDDHYESAISHANRAKQKFERGQITFEVMSEAGLCDWEGPSHSDVERYIKQAKIAQKQASCVVTLSRMYNESDYISENYDSLSSEQFAKKAHAVRFYGNNALSVCDEDMHPQINKTMTRF